MPYNTPIFSVLQANTRNLQNALGVIFGRYAVREVVKIPESNREVAKTTESKVEKTFKQLLANATVVTNCSDTKWVEEQQVIIQVVEELRKAKFNESEQQEATLFLLGALIHRYFRMIAKYNNNFYGFFSSPLNSGLFKAIREALGFSSAANAERYFSEDSAILDNLTIIQALEAFKRNMCVTLPQTKQPRYRAYTHLNKDVNFLTHLDLIIEEYKIADKGMTNSLRHQYKAVSFIQTLCDSIAKEVDLVDPVLTEWMKNFKNAHSNWSKVTRKTMEDHINETIKDAGLKYKIFDLFDTPHIENLELSKCNHEQFIAEMKLINASAASLTLFGGYALLLKTKMLHKHTRFSLLQALGADQIPTDEEIEPGVRLLNEFLKKNTNVTLECGFFGSGGRDDFDTLLLQNLSNLQGQSASVNAV